MYLEDDLLPISALQHMAFCERQAALIHIERLWSENVLTAEGNLLHERVHSQATDKRGNIYIVRGLRLRSLRLGLTGVADIVEFYRFNGPDDCTHTVKLENLDGTWKPFIVEYKRGQQKPDSSDEVQLCAQAMCLEEMMSIVIEESAFFYGKPRRRHKVILDDELRQITENLSSRLHQMIACKKTPAAYYCRKCRNCSLNDLCLPKAAGQLSNINKYIRSAYTGTGGLQ
jgi:CRISPR-associated exonuclease Cas4